MKRVSGLGLVIVVLGITLIIYAVSLLREADYLTTRGLLLGGFFITVFGGVIALIPYKIKK